MTRAVRCPTDGCEAAVRRRPATEMPTLRSGPTVTEFDVRYCDAGHVLGYVDRQRPVEGHT